jgi:hypothetical protein
MIFFRVPFSLISGWGTKQIEKQLFISYNLSCLDMIRAHNKIVKKHMMNLLMKYFIKPDFLYPYSAANAGKILNGWK